jgi:hypothetical protein
VPLVEEDEQTLEIDVLRSLIHALFETDGLDELDPLVLRYREAAKAVSGRTGRPDLFSTQLRSLYYIARLHEVLCFRHGQIASFRHSLLCARENTNAPH